MHLSAAGTELYYHSSRPGGMDLYFVHHYFDNGVMLEAGIYFAKRK